MHATGNHHSHLTPAQRLILTAILLALPGLCCVLLYAAISAHGPTAAVPGPAPITVQPAPASVTNTPPLSV